ncbi:hypothetical protein [Streptomyces sp. NPDC001070]
MSPDGRSPSPRRSRRYGRLTGVVVPLAVAAAAVSVPVLATTPGAVTTAAGATVPVNDPRPPGTRSVADRDDEGDDGGGDEDARDEGGRDDERGDQRGGRDTDRGDNNREDDRGDDQGGNRRDDDRGDDQGGNRRDDDRGDDQGENRRDDDRRDDNGRDDRGDARDEGRHDRDDGQARACVSIDSTVRRNDQEISVAVFEGRTFIGGRALPRGRFVWHSLSGNRGYLRGVCGATVSTAGSGVWVKAITRDGRVIETHCTLHETHDKRGTCGDWKTLDNRGFRTAR